MLSYSVFTPTLGMLHLIYDLWHRHSVFTLAHGIYIGTCHTIFDTWYLTPVLAMLYLAHDNRHRYLPCYIWHLIYDTGIWHVIFATWYITPVLAMIYLTPDTCTTWHMHDYYIFTRHLVLLYLLYSCIPELLYSWTPWKRVTPDIVLLLIPVVG